MVSQLNNSIVKMNSDGTGYIVIVYGYTDRFQRFDPGVSVKLTRDGKSLTFIQDEVTLTIKIDSITSIEYYLK